GGGLVVGAGEAGVGSVANEAHLRELGGHHVRGAVGRGVIDDDELQPRLLPRRVKRAEALAEQVPTVPVHDAYRHFRRRLARPFVRRGHRTSSGRSGKGGGTASARGRATGRAAGGRTARAPGDSASGATAAAASGRSGSCCPGTPRTRRR